MQLTTANVQNSAMESDMTRQRETRGEKVSEYSRL